MKYVHIVAALAVLQFFVFCFLVGRARARYGVKAPAIVGNEQFERVFRVQMNTLEQLICFLPALFLAAVYWPPSIIAAIGCVYLVGRLIYRRTYITDPTKRGLGFLLTALPTLVLLLAALAGAAVAAPAAR
jgi:uncharacterized MAPEG superfamily protein